MSWKKQNARRCELIEREIEEGLDPSEEVELKTLQALAEARQRPHLARAIEDAKTICRRLGVDPDAWED